MKKLLGVLFAVALAGCSHEKNAADTSGLLVKSDFESLDGWLGGEPNSSLTTEKAHSGKYSIMVGPGIDYSLNYNNVLGRITTTRPKQLKLIAWVYVPSTQATANLVMEVRDPGNPGGPPLVWQSKELAKVVGGFDSWQQIEQTIDLPMTVKATSTLKVYLWRTSSNQPVYLDDFALASS